MASPDLEVISVWSEIGSTAGAIFRGFTGAAKPCVLSDILKKVGRDEVMVIMALGWLSREGKMSITRDSRGIFKFKISG